jgi:hypothetical protein
MANSSLIALPLVSPIHAGKADGVRPVRLFEVQELKEALRMFGQRLMGRQLPVFQSA